ncbi:hypothetical protein DFH11DRAFT_1614001 [Phellopilus nigrolimitatus]|nr:hypothetical protein DFH11DRAFT_1614001 [Phellopilus nigrolimitatus]
MCRHNGSPAPRKRDERPLNICKQSVERLPSRQTQSTVLSKMEHACSYPSTSVRSLHAKCTEAARSAQELCGIDSASEENSDGSILETWGRLAPSFLESVNAPDCPLFEHRRLSIVLLDALVVRDAHNSQLVTYPSQKLLLAFASTLLCLPDKSLEAQRFIKFLVTIHGGAPPW